MPGEEFGIFFSTSFVLLLNAFLFSVPLFFLVLIGGFFSKKLFREKKTAWVKSALIVSFVFCIVFSAALYLLPVFFSSGAGQKLPDELKPDFFESLSVFFNGVLKVFLNALVFLVLLLPFLFLGFALFRFFELKSKSFLFSSYIAVFVCLIIALMILLAFPELFAGLIYLVYFA